MASTQLALAYQQKEEVKEEANKEQEVKEEAEVAKQEESSVVVNFYVSVASEKIKEDYTLSSILTKEKKGEEKVYVSFFW